MLLISSGRPNKHGSGHPEHGTQPSSPVISIPNSPCTIPAEGVWTLAHMFFHASGHQADEPEDSNQVDQVQKHRDSMDHSFHWPDRSPLVLESPEWGFQKNRALVIRSFLFGVSTKAPDYWKFRKEPQ